MSRIANRAFSGTYLNRVRKFPLRSIENDAELDEATRVLREMLQTNLDAGGQKYLDALTDLIEVYESRHYAMPDASESDMLRFLMQSNGVSQSELARRSGIAQPTISSIIRGSRALTKEQIVTLARVFHVAPAAFLPAADPADVS